MRARPNQIFLLAAAQAVFQTATTIFMTIGALAGAKLAADRSYATLPIALNMAGTMLAMFPASYWARRSGRKIGFLTGSLLGVAASVLAVFAILHSSFWLLCLSAALNGVYQAFAQFYRFAAIEIAKPGESSKAISYVLAGGIFAALFGPFLANFGSGLLPTVYAGAFGIMGALALVGFVALSMLKLPPIVTAVVDSSTRRLREIVVHPDYFIPFMIATSAFGIMIMAMASTPLAMQVHGYDLGQSSFIIQLHMLGMFLPSLFTGALIQRFGSLRVAGAGVVLMLVYVLFAISGQSIYHFAVALFLVGAGWNFMFVAATDMLTAALNNSEKNIGQAANDTGVFAVNVAASLGAGALVGILGWRAMNILLLPWVGLTAFAVAWAFRRKKCGYPICIRNDRKSST